MTMAFVDPRVRMRNALRTLIQADPEHWHAPSLTVFRNRLLDETGSDARPLAELLMEALQRGWRERMPRERVEPARWDALSAPFVMQWSAERFVQPDMAQWATECWALAFGVIAPEQLRIAPPSAPAPPRGATNVTKTPPDTSRGVRPATRGTTRHAVAGPTAARSPKPTSAARRSRYVPSTYAGMSQPSPRMVWSFAGAAILSYVFFIGRMYVSVRENKRMEAAAVANATAANAIAANATAANATTATVTSGADANGAVANSAVADSSRARGGVADTVPMVTSTARPLVTPDAAPRAPSTAPTAAALGYRTVIAAPSSAADSVAIDPRASTRSPGVPSVTRSLLDQRVVDPRRMLYVEPARRAQGNSRPVPTAAAPASLAFDEIVLNNGTIMRGRVEIVRAGTVIFRDTRTGLRHEIRKDSVDRIITEYGAPVRFRVADADKTPSSAKGAARRSESGPRARGVAGAYSIRYDAAVAVGSPECTDVWRRSPNSTDRATVRHVPGADTLRIDFEGGDTFLSNMDDVGYFASTFRIVPDQARSSTALTTRLTGQFKADGSLALQVIIVFFRRMREGRDVTCTVTVNATGTRG
jgi:hypothetical protein